ncbi:hypothetical protein DEA8626_01355 [Defluviimonas aquaemixtae]|uniref:Uncharacterized protein n=1 Tax=Albidovulum aquaemixtae TaxID=1542388 RepID=A0A2R8B5C7_9RHOB|nr:hypothetical protein [Defluviimonas aquaemixtae]SPH17828.1 hypothetical protein DEA8626_01355 [Defluviimonas aquaemixtae]
MLKSAFYGTALATLMALPAFADPALEAFDVAEDHTRFIFAAQPVFDDGLPAFGNAFVTQGYIYPAGTLDGGVEGVNPDGSPVWPDKVIGTWTCDGYFVGDGMHTTTGPVVITRQIFQFEDGDLLISQGPELVDEGVPVLRAITGGTGDYAGIEEPLRQVMLGMSEGMGVRLQFTIDDEVRKAGVYTGPVFEDRG